MSKFLYLIIILCSCICFECLGECHSANAGFKFYNSLDKKVELSSDELTQAYKPDGFKEFEAQEIASNSGISFEENLTNYEEVSDVNASQVMLKISVSVLEGEEKQKVGAILLLRGISPDPSFCFKNLKNDSGIGLRIKRSRFGGGGPRTIEVVSAADH